MNSKKVIKISKIDVLNNKIEYEIELGAQIRKYFKKNSMRIEYSCDIQDIPMGIAVIPLLSNILPVAWFTNSKIIVDEIDKTFYNCLENIKKAYEKMYSIKLNNNLSANKVINYEYIPNDKYVTFFSGGLDSLSTLVTNFEQKPTLVTIWGADIKYNNNEGWENVSNEILNFSNKRKLNNLFIRTEFKEFLNHEELDKLSYEIINDNWWHGVQHGIGLIGHAAPFAYLNKIKSIYIPGTLSSKTPEFKIASYPTIDNEFKFASCYTIHEGFENTRQDKIEIVTKYANKTGDKLPIRVCWKSNDGKNCSKCEKCARTILGLIATKSNPNEYGFNVDKKTLKNIKIGLKNYWVLSDYVIVGWTDIKEKFEKDKDFWKNNKDLNWILNMDFKKQVLKNKSIIGKIKRKLLNNSEIVK